MLCGPFAVQHTTGIDYREIVVAIRYRREGEGRRLSLKGGTNIWELAAVARERGWRIRRVFRNRRVRLRTLAKRITAGRWIFHQHQHLFGIRSARELRQAAKLYPTAMVTAGYLVHRARR